MGVGKNIRKIRELKDITREHMAAELHISLSGYSSIERDETDLRLPKVQQIADILECHPAHLMNFDPSSIFNVTHNGLAITEGRPERLIHNGDYRQRYIEILENDNKRLNEENEYLRTLLENR